MEKCSHHVYRTRLAYSTLVLVTWEIIFVGVLRKENLLWSPFKTWRVLPQRRYKVQALLYVFPETMWLCEFTNSHTHAHNMRTNLFNRRIVDIGGALLDHSRAQRLKLIEIIRRVRDLRVVDTERLEIGHDVLNILILKHRCSTNKKHTFELSPCSQWERLQNRAWDWSRFSTKTCSAHPWHPIFRLFSPRFGCLPCSISDLHTSYTSPAPTHTTRLS